MSIFGHMFDQATPEEPLLVRIWKDYIYYPIYRLCYKIGTPRQWYYNVKYFIQRGRRGWADRDTWGMDNHLADVLPPMLRYLKAHKHGVPGCMFEPEDMESNGYSHSEAGFARASNRWDTTIDKMIAGFEAWNRKEEGLYEKELGEYPLGRPAGVSTASWDRVKHSRFEQAEVLRERDEKIWEEGSQLFIKYFGCLWD